jgi:superkiller protein 3
MKANLSLRKSLRKLPAFRSFTSHELDALIDQMVRREYKAGESIWHADARSDFLGIIEAGDVIVEYRFHGTNYRTTDLTAGEVIQHYRTKSMMRGTTIGVRAIKDTTLYILQEKKTEIIPPVRSCKMPIHLYAGTRLPRLFVLSVWPMLIVVMILSLTWQDTAHILSSLLFLASTRIEHGDRQAEQLLEYAERLDRSAFFATNQRGYLQFQDGDLQGAEATFEKVTAADIGNASAFNNLAAIFFSMGDGHQALILQRSSAKNNPDHPVVQFNLGLLLMYQNDNDDAIHAFKEASFIQPNWASPYLQMGLIYLRMQDYTRAELAAQNAIQRDSTQETPYLILAAALYNQGRYQEAQSIVEQALQLNQKDDMARLYQAIILGKLGDVDTALTCFQDLLFSTSDPKIVARIEVEVEALHRVLQDHMP